MLILLLLLLLPLLLPQLMLLLLLLLLQLLLLLWPCMNYRCDDGIYLGDEAVLGACYHCRNNFHNSIE